MRDFSTWVASKWQIIAILLGAFLLYRYVFWGASISLLAGCVVGHLHLKYLIHVDRVHLIECNGESNHIRYYRFGKEAWKDYCVEGVMAYQHIEGNPVYFAENVDTEAKTITFAWFQKMSHFEFLLYRKTFSEMRDIVEEIVKTDTLHLTLPQVYGYGEAKKRIKNFVGAWNNIYKDKPMPDRFSKIPDEIQVHKGNFEGGAVE